MDTERKPRSLFFPLLLISAGVLILLVNIGQVQGSTWDNLVKFWPVILILGGLDGLYKQDGWVGPLVLLGLGTVLQLGNLGYLPVGAFRLLMRLWPVILVAVGLDIAFGKRGSIGNTLLRVSLGVIIVGAIVWLAVGSPYGVGIKSVSFDQPLDGATSSDITFSIGAGNLEVGGGAGEDFLVEGTASLPKNLEISPIYTTPKTGRSSLLLSGESEVYLPFSSSSTPWAFMLNSVLPMDLTTKVGVGEVKLNLVDTAVENLKAEMAIGRVSTNLACIASMHTEVNLAVGEVVLLIPRDCPVRINLQTGLVAVDLGEGYQRINDLVVDTNATDGVEEMPISISLALGKLTIREAE